MGVYIKGMEKPRDCNACFLDLYDRQTYCRNGEKALCPLIEVKEPHGRLIDIEKVLDGCESIFDIRLDSKSASTVIEAEENE